MAQKHTIRTEADNNIRLRHTNNHLCTKLSFILFYPIVPETNMSFTNNTNYTSYTLATECQYQRKDYNFYMHACQMRNLEPLSERAYIIEGKSYEF